MTLGQRTELSPKIPSCCQTPKWNQQQWPHLNLQKGWKITTPGGSFWLMSSGDLYRPCAVEHEAYLHLASLLCCLLLSKFASDKYLWSLRISWDYCPANAQNEPWELLNGVLTCCGSSNEPSVTIASDGYNCYEGTYLFQGKAVKIFENVCQVFWVLEKKKILVESFETKKEKEVF